MKAVEFKYDNGDTVKIKAIGLTGTVNGMMYERDGEQYRVAYWCNGARHNDWMYEFEIEAWGGAAK